MAKWKSPIFSDIRNKLADNVVFSMWKGRVYFRSYVIPANPKSKAQTAVREVFSLLVKRWQEVVGTGDARTAWNQKALEKLILGYNLWMQEGRKSEISAAVTNAWNGSSATVTITYTLGFSASSARIYRFDGTSYTDVTPAGGLSAEPNSTFDDTVTTQGTYEYYIADGDILVSGDSGPQKYQAITKWKADKTQGKAIEAKVTI